MRIGRFREAPGICCYNNRPQATVIRLGSAATTQCANSNDPLNLSFSYGTTTNNGNLLSQTINRYNLSWAQSYPATSYDVRIPTKKIIVPRSAR